jgi:DNA-binding NtrC family response regulator
MNKIEGALLIVDDDRDVLLSAELFLKNHFQRVYTADKPTNIIPLIHEHDIDVVLLDMNFRIGENSGQEGINWLTRIKTEYPAVEVITMTAYGDIDLAVKTMKYGAAEFITKPWDNNKLLSTVQSVLQLRISRREIDKLRQTRSFLNKPKKEESAEIQGRSKEVRQVKELVKKVAGTQANVLILGENGSGKDVVARMIHEASPRANEPFIVVDCGAITETLFESEMFGAVKGAYTDLNYDKKGRFEMANGGTLFLDEIGNLTTAMQSKLLTALQNRKILPVGGAKEVSLDIRLISATNMPLSQMVEKQEFRTDLLYRINTVEVRMPALRHRPEDIIPLANHFIEHYSKKYQTGTKWLDEGAMQELIDYDWPGNVRELQHAVERAVILKEDSVLTAEHILPNAKRNKEKRGGSARKEFNLENMERRLIVEALEACHGNMTKTAKELGITRTALYRRMDKYDLS